MKKAAFALPLALVVLVALAALTSLLFRQQHMVIQHLIRDNESEKALLRDELISSSYPEYQNPFSNVTKQFIELDGLFNVNHLVETTALEKRVINNNELIKFRDLLQVCDLPDDYSAKVTAFLKDDSIPSENFSTLDLLAEIGAKQTDIPKALMCFRVVSPLRKVNLRYVSQAHAPSLLGVDKMTSQKILKSVWNNELLTRDQLVASLKLPASDSKSKNRYQNLVISPISYHAATFWTDADETFAYIEKKFDVGLGWKHLSNKILWLPNLEK